MSFDAQTGRPPPSAGAGVARLVRLVLGVSAGVISGLVACGVLIVAVFIALAGRDEGPAPFIDPSITSAQAGGPRGDGEVRVVDNGGRRTLQRCRGACDEIIQ